MWRDIKKIIHQAEDIILTTHVNPDGDGIGSAAAFIELLHCLNKRVRFICDSIIPEKFDFLDFHGSFKQYRSMEECHPCDLLIVLDTYKKERIGKVAELIDNAHILSICIDHHPTDHAFTPHAVIDSHACSVGAMIYTLYKECGFDLNLNAAKGIYTSVISDTGRFSYSSTSRKAHKVADECLKRGVNPSELYAKLFQQVPIEYIKVLQKALGKMEFCFNEKIVVQTICFDDYKHLLPEDSFMQDLDYIHEFNKSIKGIDCAVVLWELPHNVIRVSLRSNGDLDIIKPMKELGGGGHPNAAGAFVSGTLDYAKTVVLDLLKSQFEIASSLELGLA